MTKQTEILEFEIDGVKTVVRAAGRGAPVLFLHGASTLEGFDVLDTLSDRYRLLYPSHPGMGLSGNAQHVAGMSDMVLHYLKLLGHLNLDRAPHLVGFSLGGWMATELAGLAPEKFGKVVLIAPAGLNDPDWPATDLSTIAPADLPSFLAHNVQVALRYFPTGADDKAAADFGAARQREVETVGRLLRPHGMGHPNLPNFMNRIENKTLVIWGEEDRIFPAGQAPLWKYRLPAAEILRVPGAGHFVCQDKPDTVRWIGTFLDN